MTPHHSTTPRKNSRYTMANDIITINTVSQLHEMFGYEKPKHPLVTVIDVKKLKNNADFVGVRMSSEMYMISLKDRDCGMLYGRSHYDFEEGILAFYEPGQVITQTEKIEAGIQSGWMLIFHPDLCLNFFVKFFSY